MTKTDIKFQAIILAIMIIGCATMFYICYDYSHQVDKLEKDKSELQSKLNIKNVELDIAKSDLEEAHEMAGVLFLEAMAVTDSYNELKNKCKKVNR